MPWGTSFQGCKDGSSLCQEAVRELRLEEIGPRFEGKEIIFLGEEGYVGSLLQLVLRLGDALNS